MVKLFCWLFLVIFILSCSDKGTDPKTDQLTLQLDVTDINVFAGTEGLIDLTVEGGTPPYEYLWSNGSQSQDIHVLSTGIYSVIVTDSENKSKKDSAEVGQASHSIAYCYQPQNGIHQIYVINTDGSGNRKLIQSAIGLNHHDWSPNGLQIACVGYVDVSFDTWSIHVFNADGTGLTRLTTEMNVWDNDPVWSPDGAQIAFTRIYPEQNHKEELWIMNADGSNQHFIGIEGSSAKWSSDGSKFIYSSNVTGNYEIYTCLINGTEIQKITNTNIDEWYPIWSPNDSLIAYNAYPSGSDNSSELYIMNADGNNAIRLTNNYVYDGYPRFSPSGSHISFHQELSYHLCEVFIIKIDGTNVNRVTNSPVGITAINAVWKPF